MMPFLNVDNARFAFLIQRLSMGPGPTPEPTLDHALKCPKISLLRLLRAQKGNSMITMYCPFRRQDPGLLSVFRPPAVSLIPLACSLVLSSSRGCLKVSRYCFSYRAP